MPSPASASPGRNFLFFAVLLRNMFPAVIFLVPLFILMRWLGLVNTHGSLILTYLTFGLPLAIWLLKGFYDNIPIQLEQAARIDGATRFQAFLLIVMPLSVPGIIATAIYCFILAWNEYIYAYTFLNKNDQLTLPVGIQRFFSENTTDWPGLMAASFMMSVPVVVLFLVLQKYFVRPSPKARSSTERQPADRVQWQPMVRSLEARRQELRQRLRRRPRLADRRGRRVRRAGRALGLRQDDDAQPGRRPDPSSPTARSIIGDRAGHRSRSQGSRHRHGVSELRALPATRPSTRTSPSRCRCASCRRPRSSQGARRRRRCSTSSTCSSAGRASSPAASSSAWRSAALWSATRAVFLMDEPLSNLDAKLRVQMRTEMKRFHQDLHATVIYVTHDQLEAVTMADKMAVMSGGVLQQYDAPDRRIRRPGEHFRCGVRRQPGDEPGAGRRSSRREARLRCRAPMDGPTRSTTGTVERPVAASTGEVVLGARHSTVRLHQGEVHGSVPANVYTVEPTGDITYVHVQLGSSIVIVSVAPTVRLAPDDKVWVEFDQDKLHLFDGQTEKALRAN